MPAAGDSDARAIVAALEEALLGGHSCLNAGELAERVGIATDRVLAYRRQFGLPSVDPERRVFSEADARAAAAVTRLARERGLEPATLGELIRSLGHTMDRLALWQVEALVEHEALRGGLDDLAARRQVLTRLAELEPALEELLIYSFRRQLVLLAGRMGAEIDHAERGAGDPDALPLARAVGFADMVSFTSRTVGLGSGELSSFVRRFEADARDVIAAAGGRVVKTIGDAVLYIADTPAIGAEIALGLADRFGGPVGSVGSVGSVAGVGVAPAGVTPVRVSLVWGRVLSRFGDVFGPSVTLAARLVAMAEPSAVWTDRETAEALADDERFAAEALAPRDVAGFGRMEPYVLRRG